MVYGLHCFHAHQTFVITHALWMGALASCGGVTMVAKITGPAQHLYMTLSMMGHLIA